MFRVQDSGFRLQSSGFRVQGSGFRLQAAGFRVQGSGFRVQGAWYIHASEYVLNNAYAAVVQQVLAISVLAIRARLKGSLAIYSPSIGLLIVSTVGSYVNVYSATFRILRFVHTPVSPKRLRWCREREFFIGNLLVQN